MVLAPFVNRSLGTWWMMRPLSCQLPLFPKTCPVTCLGLSRAQGTGQWKYSHLEVDLITWPLTRQTTLNFNCASVKKVFVSNSLSFLVIHLQSLAFSRMYWENGMLSVMFTVTWFICTFLSDTPNFSKGAQSYITIVRVVVESFTLVTAAYWTHDSSSRLLLTDCAVFDFTTNTCRPPFSLHFQTCWQGHWGQSVPLDRSSGLSHHSGK